MSENDGFPEIQGGALAFWLDFQWGLNEAHRISNEASLSLIGNPMRSQWGWLRSHAKVNEASMRLIGFPMRPHWASLGNPMGNHDFLLILDDEVSMRLIGFPMRPHWASSGNHDFPLKIMISNDAGCLSGNIRWNTSEGSNEWNMLYNRTLWNDGKYEPGSYSWDKKPTEPVILWRILRLSGSAGRWLFPRSGYLFPLFGCDTANPDCYAETGWSNHRLSSGRLFIPSARSVPGQAGPMVILSRCCFYPGMIHIASKQFNFFLY